MQVLPTPLRPLIQRLKAACISKLGGFLASQSLEAVPVAVPGALVEQRPSPAEVSFQVAAWESQINELRRSIERRELDRRRCAAKIEGLEVRLENEKKRPAHELMLIRLARDEQAMGQRHLGDEIADRKREIQTLHALIKELQCP